MVVNNIKKGARPKPIMLIGDHTNIKYFLFNKHAFGGGEVVSLEDQHQLLVIKNLKRVSPATMLSENSSHRVFPKKFSSWVLIFFPIPLIVIPFEVVTNDWEETKRGISSSLSAHSYMRALSFSALLHL